MQKGFASIYVLIAVLILGVIGGAYFFGKSQTPKSQSQNQVVSQTPQSTTSASSPSPTSVDETANWKTYTGKYFSFKYPAEYSLKESSMIASPDYTNGSVVSLRNIIDALKNNIYDLDIIVASNMKNLTLENALGNGPGLSYVKDLLVGKEIKRVKIDNMDAVLVENLEAGQAGTAFDMIAIKNGKIYQFTSANVLYKNINQILATFRFD